MGAPKDPVKYKEWKRKIGIASSRVMLKKWKDPIFHETQSKSMRGYKRTKEHRLAISIARTIKRVPFVCQKCGKKLYFPPRIAKARKYCSPKCFYATEQTEETKEKNRQAVLGEKNGSWQGGHSAYSSAFNKLLKTKVRTKYYHVCQLCYKFEKDEIFSRKLAVHHIDYNKNNCNMYNLILLCSSCHAKTNFNRKYWTEYFTKKIKTCQYIINKTNYPLLIKFNT